MKKESETPSEWLPFLSGGGMMGAMMRAHDWSGSPLGSPREWPQALRTTVGLMLNSKFPMFVAWGSELGFLYNDSYMSILGDKHPASLGKRFHDVWAEIWHDIHPLIVRALRGEASYMDRLPLRMRRHGYDEDTWFRFSYSPVRDEDGTVAGMFCACVEMTDEVLAQRYREEENERLVTLFEQAPGIIAVLRGPDHVFEITNRSYLQLVGHRALVGKAVRDALPEVQGQGFFELLDHVYQTGQPFVGHAVPLRVQRDPKAPLEERFIDFVYQPIHDQHGKVSGIFVEGSDVTARKRIEDELRAANRRKDQFLAMLAHELRNPLAPITTAASLLAMAAQDPARVRQVGTVISRQAAHMTGLIDDLMDVSRVTRGLVTLAQDRVALAEVIDDAVEQVRPLVEARGHRLEVHLAAEHTAVLGDRKRLVQVLSNLLNNAAKYTPPHGRIVMHMEMNDDEVVLCVIDDGIGMTPEVQAGVFDLFTQAERTPDRSQGGLGIGLALVRSLVELHGGRVAVHSEGLGRGSKFSVVLPRLRRPAALEPGQSAQPAGQAAAAPLRILVVDDNVDAAQLLAMFLEGAGYRVAVEHDPARALAVAAQEDFDVFLLDIGLPGMDGIELAQRLRRLPQAEHALLVAITGYGSPQDREAALRAGFDHHFVKPAPLDKLLAIFARRAPEEAAISRP